MIKGFAQIYDDKKKDHCLFIIFKDKGELTLYMKSSKQKEFRSNWTKLADLKLCPDFSNFRLEFIYGNGGDH